MRWLTTVFLFSLLAACNGDGDDKGPSSVDSDNDGYDSDEDCDDGNADIYPGADEICDELDNDCDDEIDEEAVDAQSFYMDADGDLYGDPNLSEVACSAPADYVEDNTDCDDDDPAINPGATEVCDELDTDEDCDELSDDEDDSTDPDTKFDWYLDSDVDGFGDADLTALSLCEDPTGSDIYLLDNTDCDDSRDDVYPGAPEVCDDLDTDENCDGLAENGAPDNDADTQTLYYIDADEDLYGDLKDSGDRYCDDPSTADDWYSAVNTDCDDSRTDINPAADEVCDTFDIDDDCDGLSDDLDDSVDPKTMTKYHVDADQDTYGEFGRGTAYCDDPSTSADWWSTDNTDCDDTEITTHPGAAEKTGDEVDSDCDGGEVCFADGDDDGYVVATSTVISKDEDCQDSGEGTAKDPTGDCDDKASGVNPGATEICDAANTDEDCDTKADDADSSTDPTTKVTYYKDGDGDTYGNIADSGAAYCDDPSTTGDLYATTNTDCDDKEATTNPGAAEKTGDEVDSDCDGGEVCFADGDDDGYVVATSTVVSKDSDCQDSGEGTSSDSTGDCNDAIAAINPGATEICDAADTDEDCDAKADDADSSTDVSTKSMFYKDGDKDTYGSSSGTGTLYCDDPSTSSAWWASSNTDCNDADAKINPGATETTADGVDSDCDGVETCYKDTDNDGYRDGTTTVASSDSDCSDSGEALSSDPAGDCNDGDRDINPGATEVCDGGVDNDCDSGTSEDGSYRWRFGSGTWSYINATTASSYFGSASSPFKGTWSTTGYNIVFCKGTYHLNATISGNTAATFEADSSMGRGDVVLSGGTSISPVFTVKSNGSTLNLQNLTIRDGDAPPSTHAFQAYHQSGGGVYCYSSSRNSKLELKDVVMINNHAAGSLSRGSAIAADGCDVTILDSHFEANNAGHSAAVAVADATAYLENVVFQDNTGGELSGFVLDNRALTTKAVIKDTIFKENNTTSTTRSDGVVKAVGYNSSTYAHLNLIDTVIESNTVATTDEKRSGGLTLGYYSEAILESDAGAGVIADNDLNGIYLEGVHSYFESIDGEFGTASGGDDNAVADVRTGVGSQYRVGNGYDFICDDEFCSNDKNNNGDPADDQYTCLLGDSVDSASLDDRLKGNLVKADRNSTIESFEVYAGVESSCQLDFYLLETPSLTSSTKQSWKVLWNNLDEARTGGSNVETWHYSGPVGVPVKAGYYYALLYGWNCTTSGRIVEYFYGTPSSVNPGFGTYTGRFSSTSYASTTGYAVGSTYSIGSNYVSTTSTMGYRIRVNFNDLESTSTASCIP